MSWALLYPLETLRSRVTCGSLAMGPSGLQGIGGMLMGIVRTEGWRALYRGMGFSLAGAAMWGAGSRCRSVSSVPL